MMNGRSWVQALLVLVLVFGCLGWFWLEHSKLVGLAQDARPETSEIVYSKENIPVVFYPRGAEEAVLELASDTARLLGKILQTPVAHQPEPLFTGERGIYLGDTVFARRLGFVWEDPNPLPEQPQSAWMRSFDGSVLFVGRNSRALAFGVYRWLQEDAGVRWFTPLPSGEDVLEYDRITLEPTERRVFEGSWLGAMLGGNRGPGRALWSLRHGLHRRFSFNHALNHIIRPEHFEEAPEMFPIRNGRPYRPSNRGQYNWQPNLAHPATARWTAAAVVEHFEKNPQAESFSVATNDNADFGEYPPIFKRGYFNSYPDLTHLVFSFTNRVARLVEEHFPNRLIGQLAYYAAENPPDYPLHPNVLPAYTADRSQWYDPAFKAQDMDAIRRWGKSGARVVGTWDYSFGYPYLTPRLYNREKLASISFLHDAGFRSYYTQTSEIWGFDAPKLWPAAQMLWDSQSDSAQVLDEFYERYYGPAKVPMRAFFDEAERLWMSQPGTAEWIKYYFDLRHALLFPHEANVRLRGLLNKAENLATKEPYRSRIALTVDAFRLTEGISALAEAADHLEKLQSVPENWLHLLQDYYAKRATAAELVAEFRLAGNPNQLHGDPTPFLFRSDSAGRLLWMAAQQQALPILTGRLAVRPEDIPLETLFNARQMDHAEFPNVMENSGFEEQLKGWRTYSRDTEDLRFELAPEAARSGENGFLVRNADFNRIWHLASVKEGEIYTAEVYLRGLLAQASRVELRLSWLDADLKRIGDFARDRLAHGELSDWQMLAVPAQAPENAVHALLMIHIRHMEKTDFLHADDFRLRQWVLPEELR
jgi:hypothetical protein